jgi:hypothetical protein
MGEAVGVSTTRRARDKTTRMLIELESPGGHRKSGSVLTAALWLSAAALVAAAGAAWWSQQRPPLAPQPTLDSRAAPSAVGTATNKPAETTAPTARSAPPASASIAAAPTAARIETVPAAASVSAVPASASLALATAVPALASATSAPQKSDAVTPSSTKTRVAKTPKASKSTKTAKQQRLAKQQLAKAKKDQAPSSGLTRVAKVAPASARGAETAASTASKDADILLLSALLAHVSRDAQGAPTSNQAQQTIAQIVQRCEARGGKDSVESIECRRRICDGYWGKAQACPANLAPKKD